MEVLQADLPRGDLRVQTSFILGSHHPLGPQSPLSLAGRWTWHAPLHSHPNGTSSHRLPLDAKELRDGFLPGQHLLIPTAHTAQKQLAIPLHTLILRKRLFSYSFRLSGLHL